MVKREFLVCTFQVELENVCKENVKCLKMLMDSNGSCIKGDKSVKQVRGEYVHEKVNRRSAVALISYATAVLVTALSGLVFLFMS